MKFSILTALLCYTNINSVIALCTSHDQRGREQHFVNITDPGGPNRYSKWLRPSYNKTVLVKVSIEMYSMASVNDLSSEFRMNLLADLEWSDPRLASKADSECVGDEEFTIEGSEWHLDRIWSPKLRVPNNKNPAALDRDAKIVLLRVTSNGYVRIRKRLNLELICEMRFQNYPMDRQSCDLSFISSDLTNESMTVDWTTDDSFTSSNNFYMTGFALESWQLKSGTMRTKGEQFSSVTVIFNLKREWGHYLFDIYLPTTLVIVVSWMTFWMDITATPARVSLGVTTMLTFVTVAKDARENLPQVNYFNALDIWFVVCTFFIFLSLVEFSVITYISRAEKRKIREIKTLRRNISQSQLSLASNDSQMTLTVNNRKQPERTNITKFPFESIEIKVPNSPKLMTTRPTLTLPVPTSPTLSLKNFKLGSNGLTPPETPNPDLTGGSGNAFEFPLKKTPVEIAESIDRKCRIIFPAVFLIFNLIYWTTILSN
ncbi:glycine receptor subunit alpha-2-like [Oppia nitens]|uniref:glycine receptor subunit alpha-2-like n=1 Tax=Oppia nitens TaxID=1686743 RepID=UPI0023DBFB76|nr:glycine receptor subunit alpha-2-like [Oppia nitens]